MQHEALAQARNEHPGPGVDRDTPLHDASCALTDAINSATDLLDRLEKQLGPVLRPAAAGEPERDERPLGMSMIPREVQASPHILGLQKDTARLRVLNGRLLELASRLDV